LTGCGFSVNIISFGAAPMLIFADSLPFIFQAPPGTAQNKQNLNADNYFYLYIIFRGGQFMLKIITDSTCDLSLEELKALDVTMLSLKVNFGLDSFEDKREITNEEFYEKLKSSKELPTTSLVGVGDFIEVFERFPDDSIVVITIASKLSGTYQSAMTAKQDLGRDDIYIVDSGSVAMALGMLVKFAAQMRDKGVPADKIYEEITKMASKVRIFAALDTLQYLVKGGRLSGMQGAIGSVLSFKPIVSIEDGVVSSVAKARGMKAAVQRVVEMVKSNPEVNFEMPISFAHSGNMAMLDVLVEQMDVPNFGGKYYLGSIVGTHSGPGAVAIAYFLK
jgi:DegV family protein with EDD domain